MENMVFVAKFITAWLGYSVLCVVLLVMLPIAFLVGIVKPLEEKEAS